MEPSPVTDHDPFSLGDSDDEDSKKKDAKDNDRLKQAAAEAMAGDIGQDEEKKVSANEGSGSLGQRDKETDNLVGKQ